MTVNSTAAQDIDSLPRIIRSIPKECLQPQLGRSLAFLGRDLALCIAFAWAVLAIDSWILGLPLSLLLGASVGGLFVIGHDCGHRSFARSRRVNDIVGHLVTSPVLWPFHVWRLDHDNHHRHTNHVDKDSAWRPVTYKLWTRMPKFQRAVYLLTRSRFFFLGSMYTTYVNFKEGLKARTSKKFAEGERNQVLFSCWLALGVGALYAAASIWVAGLYGFLYLFLIPQFVFHALLSTFTYFHHTSPDNHFLDKRSWRPELAQLYGSLHVRYPRFVEWFCHDINWHIPHHVCVGIPHYHLREAHSALKAKYPDAVKEREFGLQLIREVTTQCHFVASKYPIDLSWVTHSEALRRQHARKSAALKPEPNPG